MSMVVKARWIVTVAVLGVVGAARGATIDIEVRNNFFQPNDVTINVGDTVRWTNNSGFHDVRADDGTFSRAAGQGWMFSRTFNAAGTVLYHCSVHSAPGLPINSAMNGRIAVQQGAPAFAINQGISGAWFNPATSGQGFLLDVRPGGANPNNNFIFLAWFTFEQSAAIAGKVGAPEHRWLTAQGTYTGGATPPLPISRTAGGVFNQATTTTTTTVGTMTLTFTSCTQGSIQFDLPGNGLTGTIPITRVIPGTEALCQSLAQQAASEAAPQP